MSKRWSKLQQRLYNLMDESVGFQIHCAIYKMNSNFSHQTNPLPRYFITIGEDVVGTIRGSLTRHISMDGIATHGMEKYRTYLRL